MGLLDWFSDNSSSQLASNIAGLTDTTMGAPVLSYAQWRDNNRAASVLKGFNQSLLGGFAAMAGDDSPQAYAAYLASLQQLKAADNANQLGDMNVEGFRNYRQAVGGGPGMTPAAAKLNVAPPQASPSAAPAGAPQVPGAPLLGSIWDDPTNGALLGATGGYMQGLGPSRTPISTMQLIGNAIAGAQSGAQGATRNNYMNQQSAATGLANQLAQMNVEGFRRYQQGNAGTAVNPNAVPGTPGSTFTADPNSPGAELRPVTPSASGGSGSTLLGPIPSAPGGGAPGALGGAGATGGAGKPPPLFGVADIMKQVSLLRSFPAGQAMATQLLSMLPKVGPNSYIAVDGSVQSMPNAENVLAGQHYAQAYGTGAGQAAWAGPIASAQAWAKVGPDLYTDYNKLRELSRPGATLLGPGGKGVIAQIPMGLDGVDQSGAPYKTFTYLPTSPGGAPGSGSINPSAPPVPPFAAAFDASTAPPGAAPIAPSPPSGSGAPSSASPAPAGGSGAARPGVTFNAQGLPQVQTGLSPVEHESQVARGRALEEYGSNLDTAGSAAVASNFTFSQMRNEAQSWQMGKFADHVAAIKSYLQPLFPDSKAFDSLSDFQSFNKNAMDLTRQITRQTSSRAAFQEMQLIQQALPQATMTAGGFNQVIDQLQSTNDFTIAKQQAANAWRATHGQTLNGFDSYWNANVTPAVFLVHRMSEDSLRTMAANMQKTAEGRTALKQLMTRVTWAQQNGLFGDQP